MPSLREIAMGTKPAPRTLGTDSGTSLEQVEQARALFHLVRAQDSHVEQNLSHETAINEPCSSVSFPRERNSGTSLPDDVLAGVARLEKMRSPRLLTPEAWPIAVSDASYLAESGWAAKALALGWRALDLFGAVTDATGDAYSDGLAVWLTGRKLVAITATCATVEDGEGRHFYNRGEQVGAKLLWENGR